MSAELWARDASGVNRKFRELWAKDGTGVNRKLKEIWANGGTGVNRKIFSGFDCQAHDYTDQGIKADGSFSYSFPPTLPKIIASLTFDGPASYISNTIFAEILNVRTDTDYDSYLYFSSSPQWGTDSVFAGKAIGSNGTCDIPVFSGKSGSTSIIYLWLTQGSNGNAWLQWDAGSLAIGGHPINSVELI